MNIWIRNEVGYIDGYSLEEQPDLIQIKVKKEPVDFLNWYWDGEKLVRDVKNAPQPVPAEPTELELLQQENEELKERLDQTELSILELADMMLTVTEEGGEQ
ncbi:hypothetical protein CI088_07900 [Enterococcus plantarum]|uniref:Uncharacterized protein n=1 Tax=Enterococcus plantarum TaxID=1077675 RepID=A0A2W4BMZ7_9ENTE|nr:hypothetical protein [Enterococcus plantarum]PZL74109.1 hypothetical protein CI088_07900 [Enterococcus plantarum]